MDIAGVCQYVPSRKRIMQGIHLQPHVGVHSWHTGAPTPHVPREGGGSYRCESGTSNPALTAAAAAWREDHLWYGSL